MPPSGGLHLKQTDMKTLNAPRVLTTTQSAQLEADLCLVELLMLAFGENEE